MAWLRLDDKRVMHPKCVAAGMAASGLDVVAMLWSTHQELDGFISRVDVEMLAGLYQCPDLDDLVSRLIAVGRWSENKRKKGYMIRDFLDYNLSHEQLDARREYDRNRKQNPLGIRKDSSRSPNGIRKDSRGGTRGYKSLKALEETASDFDTFYAAYPKHVAKEAARKAFAKALERATAKEITAGAERYRDDPKRKDDYTAHPATWLNASRWEDEESTAEPEREFWIDHQGRRVYA